MAPMPNFPLSFGWNWSAIVWFLTAPLFVLAFLVFVGSSVGALLPFVVFGLLASIGSAYYVYGYLRFAVKGPSFVLTPDGVTFAGNNLRWQEILAIDYATSGRTPRIRFRQTDSTVTGFSIFDQFYGKASVSAYFISDPDSLVGWSRRMKEEFRQD
jgi:hypothetical protein